MSNAEKIVIIGDEEVVLLFALLGIEGKIVNNYNEFIAEFNEIMKDSSMGMVIISEKLISDHLDFYIDFKLNNPKPFLFLLPNIFQSKDINSDVISKKIQEYIGKSMH